MNSQVIDDAIAAAERRDLPTFNRAWAALLTMAEYGCALVCADLGWTTRAVLDGNVKCRRVHFANSDRSAAIMTADHTKDGAPYLLVRYDAKGKEVSSVQLPIA